MFVTLAALLCGALLQSPKGFQINGADLFLVNRVACAKSSCQATCERYCSSMKLPTDVTSCSSHLRLAHCSLDVEITETYNLNTSLPNVCFSEEAWLFQLPSWVTFRRIETVDLTFNANEVISSHDCENAKNLRVSIYDVTHAIKDLEASVSTPATDQSFLTLSSRVGTALRPTSATLSTTSPGSDSPATNRTRRLQIEGKRSTCFSTERSLTKQSVFLEQKKVDVYKQQIVVTGSDLRGSIEQGHLTFAVKPSRPCWFNGTGVEVQLSGIRRFPKSESHSESALGESTTLLAALAVISFASF